MNKKIIFIARVVLIMIIAINIFNSISFADSNLKVVNDSALTSKSYVNARSAHLETIKLYASASINTEYALVDINKDGNPELIIRSGNNDSNYNFHFYAFNVSELKYLESVSGVHTVLYDMQDNKYIYALYAHMNYEQVTLYGLNDNNKLVKKVNEARQLKEGEEHIGGDVKIEFVKISDTDYLYNHIRDLTDETATGEMVEEQPAPVVEFETTESANNEVNNNQTSNSFTNEINDWVDVNDTTNTIDNNEAPKKVSYGEYLNNQKQIIIYVLLGVIAILILVIYIMSKSKKKDKNNNK